MKYYVETSLKHFEAWSGGADTLHVIVAGDWLDDVENLIEECFYGQEKSETEINDFLWFERDFIAEHLGFKDFDEMSHSI